MTAGLAPRRADYRLSDDQETVRDAFAALLERECPISVVRAAEPSGFDAGLWAKLNDLRAVAMGLPEAAGGDGAGLLELALVTEELGRRLAPVPLIEVVVAARMLAGTEGVGADWLAAAMSGLRTATVALHPGPGPQLVPAGAIADGVVGLVDGDLVLAASATRAEPVPNQGNAPLAWWHLGTADRRSVVAQGPDAVERYERGRREWKVLTAAALVGMARATLDIGVEHAKSRVAFGAPIGTFQGVSHPLANVAMNVETARRMVHRAAWFADHEPDAEPHLVPMAYLYAEETAMEAATVGVHVLGGVGFTTESDQQLYFRRVKGWTLVAGDPKSTLNEIADERFGPSGAGAN